MKPIYRYILEPYKGMNTRYHCPTCQQRDKTFSRYIDTETGEQLHSTVGRCNRESKCGYHYTPKKYFQDNNISFDKTQLKAYKPRPDTPRPKPISYIDVNQFKASLKAHDSNHFVTFLINLFGAEIASQLLGRYFIGTSKHWDGATVFWQIDKQGKVRTGKIMLYNPTTGKRVKNIEPSVYWVHSALQQPDYELRQCLFGEHLLKNNTMPVAIVESEKTAIIASKYLPQFIWVAVGGIGNLNAEMCSIFKGRNVTLFPDLNGFEKWSSKAKELSYITRFNVSDLLERKANQAERNDGLDIADYLIKLDFKKFLVPEPKVIEPPPVFRQYAEVKVIETLKTVNYYTPIIPRKQPTPQCWEKDTIELEDYFAGTILPSQPVKLNNYSTVTSCATFIESHLATVRANNGKQTFLPYLKRLQEVKQMLSRNSN